MPAGVTGSQGIKQCMEAADQANWLYVSVLHIALLFTFPLARAMQLKSKHHNTDMHNTKTCTQPSSGAHLAGADARLQQGPPAQRRERHPPNRL